MGLEQSLVERTDSAITLPGGQVTIRYNDGIVKFFNPQIGKIKKEHREKSRELIREAVLATVNAARILYDPLQRNPIVPADKIRINSRYNVSAPGLGRLWYDQQAYIRFESQVQDISNRLREFPQASSGQALRVARAAVLLALEDAKEAYAPLMDPGKLRILFWRTNDYLTDFTGISDFPGYFTKTPKGSDSAWRPPFSSIIHSLNCRA